MNRSQSIIVAIGCIIAFATGLFVGRGMSRSCEPDTADTKTYVDTITHVSPRPQGEDTVSTQTYTLPLSRKKGLNVGFGMPVPGANDTARNEVQVVIDEDSVTVDVPMVRRHYSDSTYEAWVSGPIDPRLDSVRVYARTTIVTKIERQPAKRWHVGLTAGYGYGPKGLQPYVGVGITYSIFSF